MKRNKKEFEIFLRSALVTAVVLICVSGVFFGICRCYEEIRRISFNEEISAVCIGEGYIRILDFELKK